MNNIEKGKQFELACKAKLEELGFENLLLTNNTDNGADIIGTLGNTKYVFQCKNHLKNQGNKCVQEIISARTLYKANRSMVISQSGFTKSAYQLAKPNYCILISGNEFFTLTDFLSTIKEENISFQNFGEDYDLLKIYEKLKTKIGHIPKNGDLDPTTRYLIRKKYKNLTNFVNSIGDVPYTIRPDDDKIKEEYLRIKTLIKKTPTLAEISTNSNFSRNSFSSYPFTKLQKECGDTPNIERGVTKDTLINEFNELSKKIGHYPSQLEIDQCGVYKVSYYRNRWGSFDNFLSEIKLTRTQLRISRRYSKNDLLRIYALIELIFSIKNEENINSYITHTVLENLTFEGKPLISPSTFSKRFGTWTKFQVLLSNIGYKNILEEFKISLKKIEID